MADPGEIVIDPDVARAETLPSWMYTAPEHLALETARVFGRTWQLFAHAGLLRENGAFATGEVGGEPIVVVRDGEALRGFYNVCRHRAGPVAQGCGRRQTLQCRYHGWTYGLDGALLRAPEMEGVAGFARDAVRLPAVRVETWGPLVFVNLDPDAPALRAVLDDIPSRAARFGIERMRHVMHRRYEVECNWKVYVDNYVEGYHIPVVHPALNRELDYGEYRVEPRGLYSLQHAPLKPVADAGEAVGRNYVPREGDDDAQYYWLFPNVMLNLYFGQLQTNAVVPLGHARMAVLFDWYLDADAPDPSVDPEWQKRLAFSDAIQAEDAEICAVVQRNLASRSYQRGRYSVARERGVHQFHALLCEHLARGAPR